MSVALAVVNLLVSLVNVALVILLVLPRLDRLHPEKS